MYDQNGRKEANPVFPFSLRFEPTGAYKFPDTYTEDVRTQLESIKMGSTLFTVYALDKPQALGGKEFPIGQLVTASETTKSYYGDEMLLFRHQRIEDDLKLRPEWEPHQVKWKGIFGNELDEAEVALAQKDEIFDCPFAFLL